VVCGQGDAEQLDERFPGLLDQTEVVQVWPVSTLFSSTLEIRRLPAAFAGEVIHHYQPTLWEQGAAEAGRQNWEGALEWFRKYRDAGGQEIPELLSLESVCWFKLSDYERAETLLREAIRLRPLDPLNYQNLGVLHLRRGERAEALRALMTALRLNRGNAELEAMITELTR
jgi:Flp pilus assembly protein TadD